MRQTSQKKTDHEGEVGDTKEEPDDVVDRVTGLHAVEVLGPLPAQIVAHFLIETTCTSTPIYQGEQKMRTGTDHKIERNVGGIMREQHQNTHRVELGRPGTGDQHHCHQVVL